MINWSWDLQISSCISVPLLVHEICCGTYSPASVAMRRCSHLSSSSPSFWHVTQACRRGAHALGVQCLEISLGYGKSNSLRNTLKQTNSTNSETRRLCLSKKGSWSAPQIMPGSDVWNGSMNQSSSKEIWWEMSSIRSDCVWGYCGGKLRHQALGMWTGGSEPNHCAGKPD